MTNIEILKRLYKDYTKNYINKILYSFILSIIVAGSTSLIAYLLDPAIKKIFIGIENIGSNPNNDHNQNDENIDNIKCSPWAKLTISINPNIKLKPAAINA